MSTLQVTKLGKMIVEGPSSAKLSVTKLVKYIVEDTSSAVIPPRKRAPMTRIRYGDAKLTPSPTPVNTALPSISGVPEVGETLTGETGTWTGNP